MTIKLNWTVIALIAIAVFSCNPVKQVLRSPEKTLTVVGEYLKHAPAIKSDTQYVSIPGDTITTTINTSDTLTEFDTLHTPEKIITHYITKTITRTDTLKIKIIDRQLTSALQQQLAASQTSIDQLNKDNAVLLTNRNKFRLWFWLLVSALGIGGILWTYSKLKLL